MMKGISQKEKSLILILSLVVLFIALVLVYIFLVSPLLKEEISETKPPEIVDGEGLYLNTMVTIYPEIATNEVTYIEVTNETGTYTFHRYYDSTFEKEEMRIKGHERVEYDKGIFATLLAYTRLPVSYMSNEEKNAPMRNLTPEDMEKYGLTPDTCTAKYKIGYRKDGRDQAYTVYIGHPTFTDYTTYYVALEGRNTAYRFHNEGVKGALLVSLESYLTPLIYDRFSTTLNAMASVEKFKIGITDPEKLGKEDYIRTIIEIFSTGLNEDETAKNYQLLYKSLGTGKQLRIPASADTLSKAFETLFVSFTGESVVCISPTKEQLGEYGLGSEFKNYYISMQLSDDETDTYALQLSEEIDGYFYTLSNLYGEENQMLVKVPKASLPFLSTEDEAVYSWADTSVTTLFYEYLVRDETGEHPGMNTVTVRAQKKNGTDIEYDIIETFRIVEDGRGHVTVFAENSGKVFKTTYTDKGYAINQFSNYYQLLVYFPKPSGFNNSTYEEIEALKNDDSTVVFELISRDNSNNLLKFTYYRINNGVKVMIEESEGKLVDGKEVWEESQIHFNAALSKIDILRENLKKLLNGEEIKPEDYTH